MSLSFSRFWNKVTKSGLILLGLFSAATATGMGIAYANRPEQKQVISLILSTRNNPFFKDIEAAAKKAISSEKKYELQVFDSENDDNKQAQNIKSALSLGSEAVLINVVDSETAWEGGVIDIAKKKIPIFAIDRGIEAPLGKINQTIASNNVKGAKDIATWFKEKYKGAENDNVFHLGGKQGSQAAKDRTKGFKDGFGKDYKITEVADFSRPMGLEKTNVILQSRGEEFKVIFADNDEMALGAIESIKIKKYSAIDTLPYNTEKFKYYVLGFDGTKDALEAVKAGEMVATVIQQPKLMGELGIKSALAFLNGQEVKVSEDAETVVVHKGNVDQYLD